MGERPVEVINNNYYDDAGRGTEHGEHQAADQGQFGNDGYDPRNNDSGDNLRGFDDQNAGLMANDQDQNAADNVSDFADQASFDDQSFDGSGLDDSTGFDGGGGSDDNGF
jgi:hypothetical protein